MEVPYENAGLYVQEPGGLGYVFEPVSQAVIGAAIQVLKQLGPGFREDVYENALCIELDRRGILYERQVTIPVHYEGQRVGVHILDLLVEDTIVVELKSVTAIVDAFCAQTYSYLRAANREIGLILNFGTPKLDIRRIINRHLA